MAGLTTHVLDTSKGAPAFNLKIELFKINKLEKNLVGTFITNQDGRVDKPLITEENLEEIEYELLFFVGDYLKIVNVDLDKSCIALSSKTVNSSPSISIKKSIFEKSKFLEFS